jgi:hypothetical protein
MVKEGVKSLFGASNKDGAMVDLLTQIVKRGQVQILFVV